MSALENRVRQHYSKSEDHTDSDVEDIMEDVCSLIRSLFTTKKTISCSIYAWMYKIACK